MTDAAGSVRAHGVTRLGLTRLGLMIALAACGSATPPALSAPPSSQRSSEPDVAAPRDTAPPRVGWADAPNGAFTIDGLPAIARAGEVTVIALRDSDGGRGNANLRIEVRDRGDKTVQTIPVMTVSETEQLAPGGAPTQALRKRLDAANAELARLHGLHDLVAMHPLEVQAVTDGLAHLAIGDGLDVDWNQDHLHVFHHNTDRQVVTHEGAAWLVPDHPPCPTCEPCKNPAFLANVFHATGINAIVVEIGYRGTDTCWEPPDQLHAITW